MAVALSAAAVPAAARDTIRVAAASDLQTVLPEIATRFQAASGHVATLTFGSSGNFFTQIQNGAPFDVFFSADVDYPKRLAAAGLTEPGTLVPYAEGRIVLWTPRALRIDVTRGLPVLLDSSVRRIAIANPDHAPYGRAAVAALQHEQLYDRLRDKLVLGENISQTAQFVQSGNAEVGILALSLSRGPSLKEAGLSYVIPTTFYPPIQQAAVVLRSSAHKDAARALLAFLQRTDIVQLMQMFGFTPPGGAHRG